MIRGLGVAVSATLALAACGGSSPSSISPTGSASDSASPTSSGDSPPYGTEEFGLTYADLTDRAEQGEVIIGECMGEAGFEYVPVDFATIRDAMTSDKTAPGLSGTEFRREFGYGISTQPDKPIVVLSQGADNERIFNDLPESDQVAYERTLHGTDPETTWAYAIELEDFSRTGGCTRTAAEALFTPEEMLATYFNPADALIEADERMQRAIAAYADCMAAAGFEYAHPDQPENDLYERFIGITSGVPTSEMSGAARPDLEELQAFERSVAPASEKCEVDLVEPVADQIEREIFGS